MCFFFFIFLLHSGNISANVRSIFNAIHLAGNETRFTDTPYSQHTQMSPRPKAKATRKGKSTKSANEAASVINHQSIKQAEKPHQQQQENAKRLSNLLKQTKARRWMLSEWFYANIDESFFHHNVHDATLGTTATATSTSTFPGNKFIECVRQSFPQLKTLRLTQIEWNKIRRLLGKRRRCSPSFFLESRRALERHRRSIRLQQQMANTSDNELNELNEMGCCNNITVGQNDDVQHNLSRRLASGLKVTVLIRPNNNNDLHGGDGASITESTTKTAALANGIIHSVDMRPQPPVYMIKLDTVNELRAVPDFELALYNDCDVTSDSVAERAAIPVSSSSAATPIEEPRLQHHLSTHCRPPKYFQQICHLKKHLLAKMNQLQILKSHHDEYQMMQLLLTEPRDAKDEMDHIAMVIQSLYRDFDQANACILNCLKSLLTGSLGKEAVAPIGNCLTSKILMKELQKKAQSMVDEVATRRQGAHYPIEVRNLCVNMCKLLATLIADKCGANDDQEHILITNTRSMAMRDFETAVSEEQNMDILRKVLLTE